MDQKLVERAPQPAIRGSFYQLVGEHNPHGLDPDFATAAGLPGSISAGQVLIAVAARTVTTTFADDDHQALTRIAVDHAGPHVTDQPLMMRVQPAGSSVYDFALLSGYQPVLLAGRAELA